MSLHTFPTVDQGSEQWHTLRRGLITASVVGQLLTLGAPDAETIACPKCAVETGPCLSIARKTPTILKAAHAERVAAASEMRPIISAPDNETSRGLVATLALERINGWTEETPMTSDMWRGVEHEPIARDLYSEYHSPATELGFMVREEEGWRLGYSPDGLVDDIGLIEIKCPRAKAHFWTILRDEVPDHYMAQCQAGLLVSGRAWLDFVSFHSGMPLKVIRVHPDPDWFDAIEAACRQFERNVAELIDNYQGRIVGLPMTERVLEEEMAL